MYCGSHLFFAKQFLGAEKLSIQVMLFKHIRVNNSDSPYTKAGQRVMTVTPWQRNEGCVSLSINFADGELTLDNRTWSLTPKG